MSCPVLVIRPVVRYNFLNCSTKPRQEVFPIKFLHLSDLHLGKRVNGFSMLEDQRHILRQVLSAVEAEKPAGVLLAGDIYDKSVPSAEAMELFDELLYQLSLLDTQVFVISGNHDSPERVAFGGRLMNTSGIHLAPVYNGEIAPCVLEDGDGPVDVYLLPFLKPAHVRRFFPEEDIQSYTDALRVAIAHMKVNPEHRNILVAHQFVTGADRCESEEVSVGGLDNVDACVFAPFDYVALGHIHGPQNIGSERVRYCGTPLKYSFSEARHRKSITVVTLDADGAVSLDTIPLHPLRDLVELKGSYQELTFRGFYQGTSWQEDYVHVTLTDEEDIPDAIGRLRTIYHNLMKLDYDNTRTRRTATIDPAQGETPRDPLDLFSDFYQQQNNQPMSPEQTGFLRDLMASVWEGEP